MSSSITFPKHCEFIRCQAHAMSYSEQEPSSTRKSYLVQISLNRPQAINALNLDMVSDLNRVIQWCETNEDIAAIFIDGEADRGFCAGGDVKAMYASAIENPGGPCQEAEDFFKQEYQLDYHLHVYSKPVIVWGHGIVMGGGMGLLQSASHRVIDANARLAMPEVTIALFPDVGSNYFLNQLPKPYGRFLSLTGATINAIECQYLGLCDFVVDHACKASLIDNLCASLLPASLWPDNHAQQDAHIRSHIERFVLSELSDCDNHLVENRSAIETIFSQPLLADVVNKAQAYMDAQKSSPWLNKALTTMLNGSPLSLCNIDHAFSSCETLDLKAVFDKDLILSTNIVRHPEFAEGVRALLIDKDKQPKWIYDSVEQVPSELVTAMQSSPC